MGFAEEFKEMQTKRAVAYKEGSPAETQVAPQTPEDMFNNFPTSPEGSLEAVAGTTSVSSPEKPPPVVEGRKVEIKIGGKVFASENEALAYANDLEIIRLQDDAVKQHIEANSSKEPVKPEVKKIKLISDKVFENPDLAFEELEAHINDQVQARIDAAYKAREDAQIASDNRKKLWSDFYSANADFSGMEDIVNGVLTKEWETLKIMPQDAGMKELASKTRDYINSMREKILPRTALSSRPATTSQAGSISATATQSQPQKKSDDFISQVKKHGKRA